MATFQCQACGNLHGAPVEACGICGSPAVKLVPDDTPPPSETGNPFAPPAAAPTEPPPPAPLPPEVASVLEKLVELADETIKKHQRHSVLDEREEARRDRLNSALVDLAEDATTLVNKASLLVDAATAFVKARLGEPAP